MPNDRSAALKLLPSCAMAIVARLDPEGPIPLQVSWALWFARAKNAELFPPHGGLRQRVDAHW
ncbi:MAG TPA: hypothetical protein EYP98_12125 [Planctomycetes bacterium]|nr:hypothetical protein [Planctomycetota bacterium]